MWVIPLLIGFLEVQKHVRYKMCPASWGRQCSILTSSLNWSSFPLQCSEGAQWACDRIHYIPPSHHAVKSSGEFTVSSMLDVAVPAERQELWDTVPPLQIPFHLSFKLVPLGSKGICYLLYCSCRICGFPFWHQPLFTSWWNTSQERTCLWVVKFIL